MTNAFVSRKRVALLPPLFLLVLTLLLFLFAGGSPFLHAQPLLEYLPYVFCVLVLLFAVFFGPQKTLLVSALWIVLVFFVQLELSAGAERTDIAVLLTMGGIYAPPFAAIFYHLPDRNLFSLQGLVSLASIALVAAIMGMSGSGGFWGGEAIIQRNGLAGPVSSSFRISWLTAANLAVCSPFLLIRKKHQSPVLGPIILTGLLFVLASLNYDSPLWRDGAGLTAFLVFSAGAQLCLLWGILESLWRNAFTDDLTGLPGRRSLSNHLSATRAPYAVALADVDRFKKINDRYGHETGDQVLRFVASRLVEACPGKLYRYGGEEFVAVYDQIEKQDTHDAATQLRKAVTEREFVVRGKRRPRNKPASSRGSANRKKIKVTVSIGIAHSGDGSILPADLLSKADKAMYAAKKGGRNKVKSV